MRIYINRKGYCKSARCFLSRLHKAKNRRGIIRKGLASANTLRKNWLAFANQLYFTVSFTFCQVFLQRLCKNFGITSHKHMRRTGRQQPQQVCQKIGRRGNQDSKSSSPGFVTRLKITVTAADTADQYKSPDKNKGSCSTLSARKHKRHLLFQRITLH